ncbi:MAG: branched-chain amino acid ABC transporter permease [Actinomycetota bacterium]
MGTYIVFGLVSGVIYGLVALGIVLVYKGTRVFNFAQGEFGTVAMYILFWLHEMQSVNYALAALVAIMTAVAMGLVTERLVVRPLSSAPKVIALVGTAGVALMAIGIQFVIAKPQPRGVSPAFRGAGLSLFGFIVSKQDFLALGMLIVIAAGAALFFQRTYLGMGILANSQDSVATRIVGANANRISLLTWGIAGLLGGIAGVLLAPNATLVPGFMTTGLLITAFAAAVLGGMTSLVGAFVAGAIIGLIEAIGNFIISRNPALEVVPDATIPLVFVVLILTLLVRPQGLFGSEA